MNYQEESQRHHWYHTMADGLKATRQQLLAAEAGADAADETLPADREDVLDCKRRTVQRG